MRVGFPNTVITVGFPCSPPADSTIKTMNERNTTAGITATVLSSFADFIEPLRWFLLLGLVLIIADLRFGIEAARYRKEVIRLSRAIRRTVNKMIDYLCWIFVAGTMGEAFGTPLSIAFLPAVVMLVVCGIEINSCYMNYFEARGKKVKINVFKFFARKNDIIEIEEDETK